MSYKCYIFSALRGLVLFLQLQNREKHSWMSVTFGKVAGLHTYNILP